MATVALVTTGKLDPSRPPELDIINGVCAEAVSAGNVICFNTAGKWQKADADVDTKDTPLYLAAKDCASGQAVSGIRKGVVTGFDLSAVAFGGYLYLGVTAGTIVDTMLGVNQIQTVAIGGTLTGGHFHVSYGGATTGTLAHNDNAATIQAAIEALANVGTDNVAVAGNVASFTITFKNALAGDNPLVTVDTSALTTSDAITSSVTDSTPGAKNIFLGHVIGIVPQARNATFNKGFYFNPVLPN